MMCYFKRGTYATDTSMRLAREEAFTPEHGGRDTAGDVLFVMTDGEYTPCNGANPCHDLVVEGQAPRDAGIETYAIGIVRAVRSQLLEIATSEDHVFELTHFSELNNFMDRLPNKGEWK